FCQNTVQDGAAGSAERDTGYEFAHMGHVSHLRLGEVFQGKMDKKKACSDRQAKEVNHYKGFDIETSCGAGCLPVILWLADHESRA
ncbi:MAG: hypothetical protein E7B59_20295, partial [Enterobacteriaceae bacterium]|nr:hypothetical protein [Enterobacteriaceae bacterium]